MELYRRRSVFNSPEMPKYQRSLENELDRILIRLKTELPLSEEYTKTLGIVERLHKMMDRRKSSSVSKETMLTVAANLLGIILIIKHENVNVVTSKALGFVIRARI